MSNKEDKTYKPEPKYRGWWILICLPGLIIINVKSSGFETSFISSIFSVAIVMVLFYIPYYIKRKKWLAEKINKNHNINSHSNIEVYEEKIEQTKVVSLFSVVTIKYLETKQVIKVTANKKKESADVFYENKNSSLMTSLMGKRVGDEIVYYLEDDIITNIRILEID